MTDAEFQAAVMARFETIEQKLDEASSEREAMRNALSEASSEREAMRNALSEASSEREVMWHAFLAPVHVEPDQTLAEAVAAKKRRRSRRGGRTAQPAAVAAKGNISN